MRNGHRREHWIRPPGPVAPGLKIGLLGGSFNPAHCGHLHVSEVALKRLDLDYVWWLVSPQNPLKSTIGMAPLENRLKWCADEALNPRIRVIDIESELGTRYTIDTLAALKRRFADVKFIWLMGSDNLKNFRRWRARPRRRQHHDGDFRERASGYRGAARLFARGPSRHGRAALCGRAPARNPGGRDR